MHKTALAGTALTIALGATFATPQASTAMQQQDGVTRIVGVVVDQGTGQPVAGARVVLDDGRETETGAKGLFQFTQPRPGERRIAALTRGCRAAGGSFKVEPGKDALLRLVVDGSSPIMRVSDRTRSGPSVKVIPGERLQAMEERSLFEVIRRESPRLLEGGRRISSNLDGSPLLILDGTRISNKVPEVLQSIRAANVVRIEITPGSSETLQFGDKAAHGVIRVFSRLGPETVDPGRSVESCDIDWAGF